MNLTSKNYEEVPDMVNILNTFPFVQVAIGKLYIDGNAAFYKELDLDNWKYEEAISTLISSYIRIERPNYELTFKDISVFDAIFFNTVFGTSYKPNIPDCSIFYGGYSLMSNGNYCACSLLLDKGLIENEKLDLGKFDDSDKIETTKKFQIGSEYFDYKECEVCCECPFKKQCQMCLLIGLSKENRIYQIEKCRFYFNKLKRLLNEVINNRLPFQLNPNVVIVSAGKEWTVYNSLIGEHELWRVKTKKEDEIKDVLEGIYKALKNQNQVYVIAPMIEENDDSNYANVYDLKHKFNLAFKNYNVEVLHGKMTNEEKEKVMDEYAKGNIDILISTTVIEVGVDVKNATVMVIFDADRFGLSTLHQLRGRVGRNSIQSYCYLISDKDTKRLKIMEEENDGYKISEADFKLRGQGDLFGSRQSGALSFKLSDVRKDYDLLVKVRDDVNELVK